MPCHCIMTEVPNQVISKYKMFLQAVYCHLCLPYLIVNHLFLILIYFINFLFLSWIFLITSIMSCQHQPDVIFFLDGSKHCYFCLFYLAHIPPDTYIKLIFSKDSIHNKQTNGWKNAKIVAFENVLYGLCLSAFLY